MVIEYILVHVSANQLSLVNKVAAKNKFNDIMGYKCGEINLGD